MADRVQLHGYRYSAYSRVVRIALLSKQVEHEWVEEDPFVELSEDYLRLNPFGRVPALVHGEFELFETGVITRYVDRTFAGRPLQPEGAAALARMDQVVAVIDAYAYWPMVRQVASHGFFRPHFGEPADREQVALGLKASRKVLTFLDRVAAEGEILTGRDFTLADCHLAPMIDYFVRAEEGKKALSLHPALRRWWEWVSELGVMKATDPFADGKF
jgi:glutathione S-transferase